MLLLGYRISQEKQTNRSTLANNVSNWNVRTSFQNRHRISILWNVKKYRLSTEYIPHVFAGFAMSVPTKVSSLSFLSWLFSCVGPQIHTFHLCPPKIVISSLLLILLCLFFLPGPFFPIWPSQYFCFFPYNFFIEILPSVEMFFFFLFKSSCFLKIFKKLKDVKFDWTILIHTSVSFTLRALM